MTTTMMTTAAAANGEDDNDDDLTTVTDENPTKLLWRMAQSVTEPPPPPPTSRLWTCTYKLRVIGSRRTQAAALGSRAGVRVLSPVCYPGHSIRTTRIHGTPRTHIHSIRNTATTHRTHRSWQLTNATLLVTCTKPQTE